MLKDKKTQSQIADYIGVSQATISKEIARNMNSLGHYSPKDAQMFAQMRKERFRCNRKFTPAMEKLVREKLEKFQGSPEQICGFAEKEGVPMVSVERIYQFIRKDEQEGGKLYLNCRYRLKHRKRYVGAGVAHIPDRTSIHERPQTVETREEFGHFEMDLIQNGNEFILTLVERMNRYMLMAKLPLGKEAKGVAKAAVKLLKPFKKSVKTITTDNGGEFSHHKDISKALSAQIFFTDPYASWQKGAIENTNKLIRQYITKNQSIKLISQNDLALIQLKLNNRPRKKLNFQTPSAIFYNFAG